jgi:hypothetical protein
MKKEMEIVIAVIENSIRYELGQIDFMVEGNSITVFEKGHNTFSACSLIGLISKIDKVNCYLDYNKEIDKVQLRIF